jgi:hypothetical protein
MRVAASSTCLLALCLVTTAASAEPAATKSGSVTVSHAYERETGVLLLVLAVAGAVVALVGIPFIPGSCSDRGCTGGYWGWSAGGAIVTAVSLPIGLVLVNQKDETTPQVSVRPLATPSSGGLSLEARF